MPGEVVVGELVTKLTADVGDYKRGMGDARDEMEKTSDHANRMDGVLKGAVAGFALIATAAVAAGAKLFELGASFDDAYDRIRVGTGKTGEALEALQEDFRQVAANVPASFETVSAAITELHQRTGLVGPELQNLSTQLIQFSRVTGTDLSQNIALSTRMFGDWSVATDKQAETMDKVMRASQASGIATDRLMQLIVQFGGPLRQFGFSWDEAAAMLSKWEKEGVNVELVMGSMRIAIGHFAREGVDLREGLAQTIEKIKGMEDGSQAAALAMEVFGARAGPDMAAAIREGRFDFEEYLDAIENGADTILSAAEDTADAAEKWQQFGNRVALALEPVSKEMFNLASAAADVLLPAILGLVQAAVPLAQALGSTLGQAFERLGQALEPVGKQIATVQAAMQKFIEIEGLDPLTAGLQALRDTLYSTFGAETARLFERVTAAIGDFFKKLGEGLSGMGDAEGDMSGFVTAVEKISGAVNGALDALTPFVDTLNTNLQPALKESGNAVDRFRENLELLGASGEQLDPLDQALKALALTIGQTFGPDAQAAFETFTSALGQMNADAADALDRLGSAFMGVLPLIQPAFENVKNFIQGVLGEIGGFFSSHSEELQSIVSGLWNALTSIVSTGIQLAFAPIKVALQVLSGDFAGAWETINSAVGAAVSTLGSIIQAGLNVVLQIIKGAIGEWTGQFTGLGAAISDGVAAGIAGAAGRAAAAARNMVQGAYDAARAFIQPGSPSHLFRDQVGMVIGEGIAVGIDLSSELVLNAIGKMSESMLKEAWRLSKTDAFAQMGHDLISQLADAMEKGTPTAIAAVEKTGVAIQAKLKTMLPPEEAERLGGQLIAAIGEGIRGNPEGLIAVGEALDEIRDRIEEFVHEKHGEKLAVGLADALASPSSKEKLRRAGADAMSAFREAIENETDATVANAIKSFKTLSDAIKNALPPEMGERVAREFKEMFEAGFASGDTELIREAEQYFGVILEEAEFIRKQDEGAKIAKSIAEGFTKSAQKDAMSRASFEFMNAMTDGIEEGGEKARKAVETSVGKWADAMRGKLPDNIMREKIDKVMLLAQQAWETGDEGLLGEIRETVDEMENEARAIERSDALTKAFQGLGDKIAAPDVVERFRRAGETLTGAVTTALQEGTPKAIAAAVKIGEEIVGQLNKTLPPEEASALGKRFSDALKNALEQGTPEAIAALQGVMNEMGNALRASQLPKDARDMMQKVADNIASAEFKTKAGSAAADMMDAVRDRIREKTPQTEAEIVKAATAMGEKWKQELKPEEYAAKMEQLWILVEAAITTGSTEALDALMKFFLGSQKAWDDYNVAIGQKVAATPQPRPAPQPGDTTYNGQPTPPNSNFGSNGTTPPGGQTPPGTNSGNRPPGQGGADINNQPPPPPATNPQWHTHPLGAISPQGVFMSTGGSTSHNHDNARVQHNHTGMGYGQAYSEGGIVGEHGPEVVTVGEKGIEYIIPQDKLHDPEFLKRIGLLGSERGAGFAFPSVASAWRASGLSPLDSLAALEAQRAHAAASMGAFQEFGPDAATAAQQLSDFFTANPIRAYVTQSDLMATTVDQTRRGFGTL